MLFIRNRKTLPSFDKPFVEVIYSKAMNLRKELSMKYSVLVLGLLSIFALPTFACGGDKDDDKDELRPSQDISTVFCSGNKDEDEE